MLIFVIFDGVINAGLRSYGLSSGKELSINGRRLNLAPERGLADGTVCFYHFSFDFRNRLHNGNKKEITALSTKRSG